MIMKSEYTKKAEQLMKTLNITYTIEYDGIGINPSRNDKDKRTMYSVHLENSRGSMDFTFWGSILEAELRKMSMDDYCRIYMRSCYQDLSYAEKSKADRAYQKKLKECKVDIYDVVAALQKYEVGSFSDFCDKYGYDEDSRRAERIYLACTNEYYKLKKMLTEEEMEMLREVN